MIWILPLLAYLAAGFVTGVEMSQRFLSRDDDSLGVVVFASLILWPVFLAIYLCERAAKAAME